MLIRGKITYVTYCTGLVFDKTMAHGHISLDAAGKVSLTHETYLTLQFNECMDRVGEFVMAQQPGTYLIPMSLMRRGDAEDLVRALELLDPEPSPTCTYPPCLQPTVTVRDGFPLCVEHDALLRGWDELIEAF